MATGKIYSIRRISFSSKTRTLRPCACDVICRPGGTNAAGNVNPKGSSVPAMAKANMKRMIYQLRHVVHCSWPTVWADITLVSVRRLAVKAEMEASHKDPVSLLITDTKNWPKNFEAIDDYLRGLRGINGHPTLYVFHMDIVIFHDRCH